MPTIAPQDTAQERVSHARHLPGLAPYALLVGAFLLVATANREALVNYSQHAAIGAVAMLCGFAGRHVCEHRRHQVAVTIALLLIEAVASVRLMD